MLTSVSAAAAFYGPAMVSPAGGYAPGYVDSVSWSGGLGASANADQFIGGGPFCAPFFGCGPFGAGTAGGNFGAQNSAMGTFTRTTSFGLVDSPGVAFGVPVPGPAGTFLC